MSTGNGRGASPDIASLKAYRRAKQTVAEAVRSLQGLLKGRDGEQNAAGWQDLMVKLAEDRFTMAVVGQFKRGKSSLMNAIVGRNLLPTGILPLTSAITILQFGAQEKLVVERDRRALFAEEAPINRLPSYVTQKGNPGNHKRVKAVRVLIPSPFLRQGIEFVDTPGVGSSIEANTATTYTFLPHCDAVLFVTGADGPLTSTEVDFLDRVREYVRKVFLVVNKMDLLNASETEEVLDYVATTLAGRVGLERVSIYPISSSLGLQAKTAGDSVGYARSGLKDLEEALAVYLAGERASTFLVAVLDKAVRLLTDPELRVGNNGNEASAKGLVSRMVALRQRLLTGKLLDLQKSPALRGTTVPGRTFPTLEAVQDGARSEDLARDLGTRGCPVCQRVWSALFQFFATWQHEIIEDPEIQLTFATELGFCPFHTWQLELLASPQGLSKVYPRLADRVSEDLARLAQEPAAGREGLERLLQGFRNCRACQFREETEQCYILRLAEYVSAQEGRKRYARSQGVCLRHLIPLLDAVPDKGIAEFLLTESARHFEEYAEDMRSYATKRDAIRRGLLNLDEEDAYLRTLVHVAGEKPFSGPAGEK